MGLFDTLKKTLGFKQETKKEPKKQPGQQSHTDPVLHYEATEGKFGKESGQSLTYSGKKTRWR